MHDRQTSRPPASLTHTALGALGLLIVLPALVIYYLFRDAMEGKESILLLVAFIASLGFYLLWTILRGVNAIQEGLEKLSRGEAESLTVDVAREVRQIAAAINALDPVGNARRLAHEKDTACELEKKVQRQEAEIRQAHGQVLRAEKYAALGELAGGVAHDFNNILQAIFAYTKMGQKDLPMDGTPYSCLQQIHLAAEKAATMTRQLLAFGRRQVLRLVDLDLNEVIKAFVKMARRVLGEQVAIDLHLHENLAKVHADPGQLERALMNLCINARDAMPAGGRITIGSENVALEVGSQRHPEARPGEYTVLSVSDTGSGMDDATLKRVFEPFFTTKEAGKGSGLGLATVYGIVKQHDGMIDVVSTLGEGTTFEIWLPVVGRHAETVERKADEPTAEGVQTRGSETILVAEDDETLRNLNEKVLEDAGYTVLCAPDGKSAMEVFQTNADRISLVLLDAVMPGASGREVYDHVKSLKPEVRVVVCSGFSTEEAASGFIRREALPLIKKPFAIDQLLRVVRESLDTVVSSPPA